MMDEGDREMFLETVEHATSPIEVWALATVMGYRGSMSDLMAWADELYPRIDRRKRMTDEAELLRKDIEDARVLIDQGAMDPEKGFARVAFLSREMRGHLVEVEKMSKTVDRRGLILAGAERVMRELRGIFAGSTDMENALEAAFKAVWAVLAEEK
jgi:hypothetical protein